MEIKKIRLRNFLSFGNSVQELDFSELNTMAGPNGSGKTNVFHAIELAVNLMNERLIPSASYYHDKNLERPFEIEIDVKFNDKENEMLTNFLICSCLYERIHVLEGENEEAARTVLKNILHKRGKEIFSNFFDDLTIVLDTEGRSNYSAQYYFKMRKNGQNLFYRKSRFTTKLLLSGGSYSESKLEQIMLGEVRKQFPELNKFIIKNQGNIPDLKKFIFDPFLAIFEKSSPRNSVELGGFRLDEYASNRENIPEFIRLRDFIRQTNTGDDRVSFPTIIAILFKNSLVKTDNIRSRPKSLLNPQNLFYEKKLLNLSGENITKVLYSLSQSDDHLVKKRFREITSQFGKITKGLELELRFTPKTFDVSVQEVIEFDDNAKYSIEGVSNLEMADRIKKTVKQEISLQVIKKGIPISIEFTSAGIIELIILLTALIGQQDKVILLDEPAANLHSILQQRIMQIIKDTTIKSNNQVIIITHSPFLVTPESFEHVWKFSSLQKGTEVVNLGQIVKSMQKSEHDRLIARLRSSDVRAFLFQHGLVMVEGPSDKVVLEKADRYFTDNEMNGAPNIEENEWLVLDVCGKKSLPMMINLAKKLNIPHTAVLDYDGLMLCDEKILVGDKEVKTSSVIKSIYLIGALTDTEQNTIVSLERSITKRTKKMLYRTTEQFWYDEKSLDTLNKIAKKHNFYVFTTDLEGVLQNHNTSRARKPLRDLEAINSWLDDDKIPAEIKSAMKFIKNKIEKQYHT